MKFKTWLRYWPNLFNNSFFNCLLALVCLSFSQGLLGQEKVVKKNETPGVLESLESLMTVHRKQYDEVTAKMQNSATVLQNISNLKEVKTNPYFFRSLMFHSDSKYTSLISKDNCAFYSLLENDLLKTTKGKIRKVIVDYKTVDGKKKTAIVTTSDFLNYIYKIKCFNNRQISTLFNDANIKSTLEGVALNIPKTSENCKRTLSDWRKNPYLPYLCKIPEVIKRGQNAELILKNTDNNNFQRRRLLQGLSNTSKKYRKSIPYFQRSYFKNLCNSLDSEKKFCSQYLSEDVWSKTINGELPLSYISYKCRNILKRETLKPSQLQSCATKFNSTPKICTTNGANGYPSLYPYPNCTDISRGLLNSKLKTDYHDCPGNIDNEGLTNIHRIITHLTGEKIKTSPSLCSSEANYTYVKLNDEYKNKKAWPLKICYQDKALEKEACLPYLPGKNDRSKISEDKVVSQILQRIIGAPSNLICKLVGSKEYNPIRLEYKNGCFIVFDTTLCSSLYCPKKIIYEKKEIQGLTYKGAPVFDYFPTSFSNSKFSISNIISEVYKVKNKKIRNLTELLYFFDNTKTGIIHGIGCAEDILPQFFKKRGFNQCHPLPFIVDGYSKKNNNSFLSIRTAIDDLHSPRLVNWNFIFSSIANYRELHPLSTWTLYGIN